MARITLPGERSADARLCGKAKVRALPKHPTEGADTEEHGRHRLQVAARHKLIVGLYGDLIESCSLQGGADMIRGLETKGSPINPILESSGNTPSISLAVP